MMHTTTSFLKFLLKGVSKVHQVVLMPIRKEIKRNSINKNNRCIFVDCGANDMMVLNEFVHNLDNFEFYAFEPQTSFKKEVEKIKKEHPKKRIEFINKAVWIEDGVKEFYLEEVGDSRESSTLLEGHNREIDYDNPVKVKVIDFERWITDKFSPKDYIIVKMDIEGAEYDIIDSMFGWGKNKYIDEMIVEFHYGMNDNISISRHLFCSLKVLRSSVLKLWH